MEGVLKTNVFVIYLTFFMLFSLLKQSHKYKCFILFYFIKLNFSYMLVKSMLLEPSLEQNQLRQAVHSKKAISIRHRNEIRLHYRMLTISLQFIITVEP